MVGTTLEGNSGMACAIAEECMSGANWGCMTGWTPRPWPTHLSLGLEVWTWPFPVPQKMQAGNPVGWPSALLLRGGGG